MTVSSPSGLQAGTWEQRWHPLLREWVIVSAHRQDRPWSGEHEQLDDTPAPSYDPGCFLCPGNQRISGETNPPYTGVFVFDNDRPSLAPYAPVDPGPPTGLYQNRPATGLTRVLCYTPAHNGSVAELDRTEVHAVVQAWQQQTRELVDDSNITSVVIFENKGELCGMSNPHPHGQIYATNFIYTTTERHQQAADEHYDKTGRVLFQDILAAEIQDGLRIVCQNRSMVAFVPWFARFAYEVLIAPRRPVAHVHDLSEAEAADMAALLHEVTIRMDNLWQMPFPYLMMLHQAPVDGGDYARYPFHLALYPPLRKPGLRKYVAAHEIGGGNFLADTRPEDKAAELRAASPVHYRQTRNPAER